MPPRRPLAALLCLFAASTAAGAAVPVAPLADRVPADALVYVGWAGGDACPGYDASHLRAVVDHSSIPQLFTSFVPQVVRRVARLDDHAGQVLDQVVSTAGPMWRHPTAFYFGGVDFTGPKPTPRLAVLCDAGPDAPAVRLQLTQLLSDLPPDVEPRPTVTTTNGLVVLAMGQPLPPAGLATGKPFAAALAQCNPAGAALVGYVDVQGIVSAVDAGVARANDPDVTRNWPKVRDALGLGGLRQAAMTAGFDGRDWVERSFASTDGTKTGLLALADGRPLDADLLSVVPVTADQVSASRVDLAAGFDALHDAVGQFDPGVAGQVDDFLARVDRAAGVNVRRDLIGSLGDQWVAYADRSIGGTGTAGTVLVNRLRDPARADDAMTQVSRRLNFIIAQQLHNPDVRIQFREQPVAGTTLHYLAVPLVTPTWAIKGNTMYVGLYPQVVTAAVDEAAHHKASILQRPEFTATLHRLGDRPASSLAWVNLPAVAPDSYADLLAGTRLWLGLGDVFGAQAPILVRPPAPAGDGRADPRRPGRLGRRRRLALDGRQPLPRRRDPRRGRRGRLPTAHDDEHARPRACRRRRRAG